MVVRELITKLGFKTDKTGLAKAEQGFTSLRNTALGISAAVVGVGAAVGLMLKRFANNADQIAKIAPRGGLSTTQFQKLPLSPHLSSPPPTPINTISPTIKKRAPPRPWGLLKNWGSRQPMHTETCFP